MSEEQIEELKSKYGYDDMSDEEREDFERKLFDSIYGNSDSKNDNYREQADRIDEYEDIENHPKYM